jgi:transcriptional regulator with XRE-family HTH domain
MDMRDPAFDPRRFVSARKSKNLSQRRVAALVHISQAQVAELEGGKRPPTRRLLAQLAAVLGVAENELRKGDGT